MFLGKVQVVLQHGSEPHLNKEPGSLGTLHQYQSGISHPQGPALLKQGVPFEGYFSGEGEQ